MEYCRNITSFTKPGLKKYLLGLLLMFSFVLHSYADVNSYTFSQNSGTYIPLTAGRIIVFTATASATSDPGLGNDIIYTLADSIIPFDFAFAGAIYRTCKISTNGFISFGTTAPVTTNYTPLSSSNTYLRAISAIGQNLSANTNTSNLGEISYEVIGTAPNRTFAIQFSKFRRSSNSSTFTENYNFQIRLSEAGGILGKQLISIVYGTCTTTNTSTASGPQVGLRGVGNVFPDNINNRTSTGSWSTSAAGTANNSFMVHTTTVTPASGQTYTWTPPLGESCTDSPLLIAVASDSLSAIGTLLVPGYTQDGPNGVCFDTAGNSADADRWTKFVAPATGNRLFIFTRVGTLRDLVMELWTDCPGTGYLLECSDDVNDSMPEIQLCNYIPGHTYYVRTWPYVNTDIGNYILEVYQSPDPCPSPPGNDSSNSPQVLNINSLQNCPINGVFGSTINASTGGGGTPACASFGLLNDVWYSFNSGANCQLTLNITPNTGIMEYAIYTAFGTPEIFCLAPANGPATITGLTINTNYLIRVWSIPLQEGDFSICLSQVGVPSCIAAPTSPVSGATGITDCGTTLSWPSISDACGYDVYFNTGSGSATTLVSSNQSGTSYTTGTLLSNQAYSWKIAPRNGTGTATGCSVFTFTTGITNDGNPCTADVCNSITGIVTHTDITPSAPTVTAVNNCGNTVLTVSNYTGSLLWSTGATTASTTVSTAGNYTVTQTVGGCSSPSASGTAAPKAVPSSPTIIVSNNCTYSTLIASNYTGTLLWSTGATTASITANISGTYTLTQTVNGCISAAGSGTAAPNPIPSAPTVTVTNNCGNAVLTAGNYTGSLLWNTGQNTASITVNSSGTFVVTQTVNGCESAQGSGTSAPKTVPLAPSVSVNNNCGNSLLTASNYTGSLLWSTGATSASITVTTAGNYSVTQTLNGCPSLSVSGTAAPTGGSIAPTVTVVDNCGSSILTASNYTGSLLWNTGQNTASITVTTSGTYSVTQTVNGCTSAAANATASPKSIPLAPTITVSDNCGNSVLTAGNYTGSLLWSTGATSGSISVTASASYTLTQSLNGCISPAASSSASPKTIPSAPTLTVINNCGNSLLTAGSYTGSLLWSTGASTSSISVIITDVYTVTQTIANGCTSSVSGAAAPKTIPSAPTVTVSDNCGNSVLTAGNYTGSLLWSTGAATASITVSTVGTYTVTQTVNGCVSASGSGTAAPKSIPSAPTVSVVNNCGNSVLTAANYTGSILWSTGASTASITISASGSYTVTQTVNGCTNSGSGTAAPIDIPSAPIVTVTNNCGNSVLTASNYTGTLLWNTGASTSSITVATAGTYTVTQTVNGCTSTGASGTSAPKSIPSAPTVTVSDNCGSSQLTAANYTGSLLWNTGANTATITVVSAGNSTVTQTINGCVSSSGSGTATPKTVPSAPTVTATNNCGNSLLTAGSFTGSLLWSTGSTTTSITVSAAGSYSVTQTVNGCISANGSITANPKTIPSAPTVTVTNNCINSVMTAGNYTGSLLWSTGAATASITVTTAGTYTVTQTVNGCVSAGGNGIAAPKGIPSAPSVSVVNNCGNSSLIASGYTGSLLWSTGANTSTITVSFTGSYTVTQTVNGCTSAAGSGSSSPKSIPSAPTVSVSNNCGSSILTASNYTGALLWSTGATSASINLTTSGVVTVTQTVNGCVSAATNGTASPKTIPSAPIVTVTNNCGNSTLTASNFTGTLLWSTNANTASITVASAGTRTVTQTIAGCVSAAGSGIAAPKSIPSAPIVIVTNNCGNSILTATNYSGTLFWSTGLTAGSITVTIAGSNTVTQTVNGCISAIGSGTAAPKAIPVTPTITVVNNCTNSVLTAGNYTGSLLWSTGSTASSITINNTVGQYTLTQTINGCVSPSAAANAFPKALSPALSVTNDCGNASITASNYTGSLLWSNGETTATILVTNSGTYTVTQTVSGCSPASSTLPVTVYPLINNVTLNLKFFIEGFYIGGGIMAAVIDPVNYPTLCDTVTVELHESNWPNNLVQSILGTIDIYGNGNFSFPQVSCNNYYIVVRHRNSIETWSKLPLLISAPNMSFDLTH